MTDLAAAWLRFQLQAGEAALAMRQSGGTWRHIAESLRLADETRARRCVALYLSADLASREAAGERAGDTRGQPGADASAEIERSAAGAG